MKKTKGNNLWVKIHASVEKIREEDGGINTAFKNFNETKKDEYKNRDMRISTWNL